MEENLVTIGSSFIMIDQPKVSFMKMIVIAVSTTAMQHANQ